jgi:heparan-alpha-glucosaminide N-acetyltransferase
MTEVSSPNNGVSVASRFASVDVMRGGIVAMLVLVEYLPPAPHYAALRHSPWNGVRFADFVFPAFVFLVGVSEALASRRRGPPTWNRIARRAIVLLLLGFLFNSWADSGADLAELRLTGVLQMLAVAGLLAGIVTRLTTRLVAIAAIAVVLHLAHGIVLLDGGRDCNGQVGVPGCSAAWTVDSTVFGDRHLYREGQAGHDPEGLLSAMLGGTSLVLSGHAVATMLHVRRRRRRRIAGVAVLFGTLALLESLVWPLNKRLWTPSFAMLMAATCTAVLLASVVLFDRKLGRVGSALALPLSALSVNALAVYVGQHLLLASLTVTPFASTTARNTLIRHAEQLIAGPRALLLVAAGGVTLWTAISIVLRQLGWRFSP